MKLLALDSEKKLAECARQYVRVFDAEPWNDQWTEATAFQRLFDCFKSPGNFGLYGEDAAEVLGALAGNIEPFYSGPVFNLKEIFVLPSHQRKGIGERMLTELKRELKRRDVHSIQLFTSKKLPPFFYRKNGFEIIKNMVILNHDLGQDKQQE